MLLAGRLSEEANTMIFVRRGAWIPLLFAVLAGSAPALAQQEPFTIEQVMSAPFPSDLVASPAGGVLAWVFDARGVRNIWVAAPPDYRGRALTSYTADDGQEIAELAWTPDAHAIVYTRGGDFETQREAPNPLSDPQGVEQDVWVIALEGDAPRKLAEGHSPAVSPKNDEVAFVFKDQIWLANVSGSEKPAQLIHSRGKVASLRWSPDGSQLAFVSAREDHSFIGIYDFAQKSLRYLDPSTDRDLEPVWSPDGKQVAYLRLPAAPEPQMFGPERAGPPWSIRVADVGTGEGREIWKAHEAQGSVFHFLAADQQLFWAEDGRLIFPWEGDGWTHLYSVPISGGEATLMTPGDFEVENVTLGPDRREVLFNSNQDDADRRHLWKEDVSAKRPTQVTSGQGIEWSPVILSDGRQIALLHSDAQWPARPALIEAGGAMRDFATDATPKDFPASQLVTPQPVMIAAADGLTLHGQIFLPRQNQNEERYLLRVARRGGRLSSFSTEARGDKCCSAGITCSITIMLMP